MLRNLVVTLVWAVLVNSVPHASAVDFFDGPTASPGDPMFFSIYSVLPSANGVDNMQKIADGGFTAAGPYFGTESDPTVNPDSFHSRIAEAADHGLGYIAHIVMHPDIVNDTSGHIRDDSMKPLTDADSNNAAILREHVHSVMDKTLNNARANATVHAWYIQPEELRWWRSPEKDYLNIVASEIALYDPQNRPVSMYNPGHRDIGGLEAMTNQGLDWTMMGVYVTDVPFATRGARIADGVNRIVTAAGNTQTTPIPVLQLSEDFDSTEIQSLTQSLGGASEAEAIEHVIRNDAYQSLIRGARGFQIWSGFATRPGLSTFREQLDGYISVSRDMNGAEGLANVFLQGETRNDLTVTQLNGPESVTHDTTTIDTVAMANMAYGGGRTLIVANSSNDEISVNVSGLPIDESVFLVNLSDHTTQLATGSFAMDMKPLDVAPLQIFRPGDLNLDGMLSGDGTGMSENDDVSAFIAGWTNPSNGDVTTAWGSGDMNLDGNNDLVDILLFQQALNDAGNPVDIGSMLSVPEPSTVVLLSIGLLCWVGWSFGRQLTLNN